MSFRNGYYGAAGGAAQVTYQDQPGAGVPGMLAFASDLNLTDSMYVSDAAGVSAGKGVKQAAVSDTFSMQEPKISCLLPTGGAETIADFAGIVVFDEGMQSDENGNPGWDTGRMAQILRPVRGGGRIHIKCREAFTAYSSTLNWVIVAGTTNGVAYVPGDFAPAALGGAGAGTSVAITTATVITSGAAGGTCIVEVPNS
jgi:hypothetical protein